MSRKKSVEELKEDQIRRIHLYSKLFSTPDGKEVLVDLKKEFYDRTSIVGGDPYATHAMEGAREVILFILQNMEISKEIDDVSTI